MRMLSPDEIDPEPGPTPASCSDPAWMPPGVRAPQFRDERVAPTVDHALLARLAAKELCRDEAAAAYRLINSYRSWMWAYSEALAEKVEGGGVRGN